MPLKVSADESKGLFWVIGKPLASTPICCSTGTPSGVNPKAAFWLIGLPSCDNPNGTDFGNSALVLIDSWLEVNELFLLEPSKLFSVKFAFVLKPWLESGKDWLSIKFLGSWYSSPIFLNDEEFEPKASNFSASAFSNITDFFPFIWSAVRKDLWLFSGWFSLFGKSEIIWFCDTAEFNLSSSVINSIFLGNGALPVSSIGWETDWGSFWNDDWVSGPSVKFDGEGFTTALNGVSVVPPLDNSTL